MQLPLLLRLWQYVRQPQFSRCNTKRLIETDELFDELFDELLAASTECDGQVQGIGAAQGA